MSLHIISLHNVWYIFQKSNLIQVWNEKLKFHIQRCIQTPNVPPPNFFFGCDTGAIFKTISTRNIYPLTYPFTSSDAPKAKICPAMKCVTFHFSRGSMVELPELIVILSVDSEITGSITIGFTNLTHVVNYIWKIYFLKKCLRLVKNANNLTVSFDNSLNHISYLK